MTNPPSDFNGSPTIYFLNWRLAKGEDLVVQDLSVFAGSSSLVVNESRTAEMFCIEFELSYLNEVKRAQSWSNHEQSAELVREL